MLGKLTGTGCMCSSLIGAFCGASPGRPFEAAAAAMMCMGISGEIAYEKAGRFGIGSFRAALHDAISLLDYEIFERMAKYYET
jgi:hydroxyethylthiazole kinase